MPHIKPFRTVNEYDTINLYAISGSSYPYTKGTIVKLNNGSGSVAGQDPVSLGGPVGASWGNTVSTRWAVTPRVSVAASGETPFGMLLYDVRETDENGENLLFRPEKLAEMQSVLSGQAVPIVFKGVFDYSGVVGNPNPGDSLYSAAAGGLGTVNYGGGAVAKALGVKNAKGFVRIKLDL